MPNVAAPLFGANCLEIFFRSLSARGVVRSQALEALGKEEANCAARSVGTCAHTWRPLCVSSNEYFLLYVATNVIIFVI